MNKYSLTLLGLVSILFCMGMLMVFNTTAAEVLNRDLNMSLHEPFIKQLAHAVIAFGCAAGAYFLGFENVLKLSGVFLLIATLGLLLVFVPGVGCRINGAHRWIHVMGTSLQPSEFVKYLLPLYTIHVVSKHRDKFALMPFIRLSATLVVPIGLILIEPDNGSVAIILMTLLILFILMRIRWIYWAVPLIACILCGGILASRMDHVADRIAVYINPEKDLKGKGHQPHQARIAAGSGGFLGKGFGESLQKMDYLPEARSDYIAAIYAEEFGFLGILGLIFLYMSLGGVGFRIALHAKEVEGFYLAGIITFLICFQAFLNLGVVSGLLPSKGTNLPFFSHGGSSLLVNFIALGLVFSVGREQKNQKYAEK